MSNTTTTTATPQIDAIREFRENGNRMEEHVAGNMLRAIREYQHNGIEIIAETRWVERQMAGVRARVLDGNRIDPNSFDVLAKKAVIRQEKASQICDLAYMLSIDGNDYDALWNEIEAGIQQGAK